MFKLASKILPFVLLLALLLSACAPAAPASNDTGSSGADTSTFAYSQAELVNAWRVTNQKDMEEQAKTNNIKLISIDANQDASKQLANVENIDLTAALKDKYGSGCPGCGKMVCTCDAKP